ncbi:MAG TPA: UDP-N-acetylenolpyruvoylglucosamine reductase, partial [Gammaproteobacteria bacterium]|nr:UDP-N-acetylenolpyruvoylglucosamine reductase [Gammaproteobacteria bacterium]
MAKHTSWKVGGPARYFFEPRDCEDLTAFLQSLDVQVPVLWLGLGSNLLVRDGGFEGAVIAAHRGLRTMKHLGEGYLMAEAGVSCARFSRFAGRYGWTGAEFLAGVPGTMGGALAMNAGAFGGETWDMVEEVDLVDREGVFHRRPARSFAVSYRRVEIPKAHWFTAGYFKLGEGLEKGETITVRSLLQKRAESQPVRQSSAGSVFRNPLGDHA